MRIDTWAGSERVVPYWQFESFYGAFFSRFPLASHLALPGSESVFGISQRPPTCTHSS